MTGQLLTTKLCAPRQRPDLVLRPRLIEQLTQGLRAGHRLTLLSASPGFGKTTLIVNWKMTSVTGGALSKTPLPRFPNLRKGEEE